MPWRSAKLGTSLVLTCSPVLGEVSWDSNHSSMARLSYVWPSSHSVTGSDIKLPDMRKSVGCAQSVSLLTECQVGYMYMNFQHLQEQPRMYIYV